jgi:serine/threonine protein phosphatase PrpC
VFQVFSSSVTGASHLALGRTNEDHFVVGRGTNDWIACVVSDGCGSAEKAATGSKTISELVCKALLKVSSQIDKNGVGEWLIDDVIGELAKCKMHLRELFGPDLRAYHATIVAALISEKGGFLLHIGDGIASSFKITNNNNGQLQLSQATTSEPENGEYANETFYLTEPSWIRHIRLTPLTDTSCVILCTDGAQDILFPKNRINNTLFSELLQSITVSQSTPNSDLTTILTSASAQKISSDDKTALLILSEQSIQSLLCAESIQIQTPTPTKPATTPTLKKPKPSLPKQAPHASTNPSCKKLIHPLQVSYTALFTISFFFILGTAFGFFVHLAIQERHYPLPKIMFDEKSNASGIYFKIAQR